MDFGILAPPRPWPGGVRGTIESAAPRRGTSVWDSLQDLRNSEHSAPRTFRQADPETHPPDPKASKMPVLALFVLTFLPIKNQSKIDLLSIPSKISKVSPKSAQGPLFAPFWVHLGPLFWSILNNFSEDPKTMIFDHFGGFGPDLGQLREQNP